MDYTGSLRYTTVLLVRYTSVLGNRLFGGKAMRGNSKWMAAAVHSTQYVLAVH
jgi:hypothetical protein